MKTAEIKEMPTSDLVERVEAEVAKMAEAYNMTLPQIKEALKSNDLEDIKGQLRIRKTIDFLVENAVIA